MERDRHRQLADFHHKTLREQKEIQLSRSLKKEVTTGAIALESDIGEINYLINEEFTMATQQPVDQGKAFETAAGTNTSSTEDDILDFSERNPFGEVNDY